MKAQFDNDYNCLLINTHQTKIVISDYHIGLMKSIDGVHEVVRYGTYGMELFVIHDMDDLNALKGPINKILSLEH